MTKYKTRTASGTLELDYEWKESSSGHVEDEHSVTLEGRGAYVVLKDVYSTQHFIKINESSRSCTSYKISTSQLITLIKEHGER